MPPDDFYNDVDAGARPTTLRPHADGEPYAWVTGPCGTGQPHACSSGVGEREARTTLSKTSVNAPEDLPRPVCIRTPVVARQHRSLRGRRLDRRFNRGAMLLAEPRTNPPW
jgi:hypothetical protein